MTRSTQGAVRVGRSARGLEVNARGSLPAATMQAYLTVVPELLAERLW